MDIQGNVQGFSTFHEMSMSSIVEDNVNSTLMKPKYRRLKKHESNAKKSSSDKQQSSSPSSDSNSSVSLKNSSVFQRHVDDSSTSGSDSHGRSVIERQRRLRKQDKTKRKKKVTSTTIVFKRRIRKESVSPALAVLRKHLVMEVTGSDSDCDCCSEDDENIPVPRIALNQQWLGIIGSGENKENIDLKEFQEKMRL